MVNKNWIVEYNPSSFIVCGFYPPDYKGVLPAENFVAITQDERDWLYSEVVQHTMCYDPGSKTFKQYEQPFYQLKNNKLAELENLFDSRVSGSFICSQAWPMQFDRSDTLAVEGVIQLMKATGQHTGYLTDANDVTHYELQLETIETVKIEMLCAYAACHARKQELRTLINAAQTAEDLDEIIISWPV